LCFVVFLEQGGDAGAPVGFVGFVAPLPWRAAEAACQEEGEPAERALRPLG